jgi:hypothetical protein
MYFEAILPWPIFEAEAILPPRQYCQAILPGNIASRGVCAEAILPPEACPPRQYCLPRLVRRGYIAVACLTRQYCRSLVSRSMPVLAAASIFRDAFLGQQKCNSPLVSKNVFLRYDLFIWFYILMSAKMTGPRSKFYSVLIIRIN